MRAKDVMSSPVTVIGTDATLLEAAKLLVNTHISALPVVDGTGAVVGIVSEIDLIRHVMGDAGEAASLKRHFDGPGAAQALAGKVTDLMTTALATAGEDDPLENVAALMMKHGVKRLPILRDGKAVGMVSRIDLVKSMLSHAAAAPTPAAARRDDEEMRRDVVAAIHRLGIPLGGTFDVVVKHGVAHLWGRVSTPEEDEACQVTASEVPGITGVMSHMQALPRSV
jgi:CBS domain-containing protein